MPIQTQPAALKVNRIFFEARFDEGYRYLDRCGEMLVRIRKHNPAWVPTNPNPQLAALGNGELGMSLNVNSEHMVLATNDELSSDDAAKKIESMGKEAEALYEIVVQTLSVPNTTRAGLRAQFLAEAGSLEEANRFMCRVPGSRLRDHILDFTRSELRNTSVSYTLEDLETGVRRSISLSAVARVQAGGPPITGLATDRGSGAVMADVDTFTRPEQGHLGKLGVFIRGGYTASRGLAEHVFGWLVKQ